jgi:hypothetical protein
MHPDEINAADFAVRKADGSISAIIDDVCLIKYFGWKKENMQIVIVDDRDRARNRLLLVFILLNSARKK